VVSLAALAEVSIVEVHRTKRRSVLDGVEKDRDEVGSLPRKEVSKWRVKKKVISFERTGHCSTWRRSSRYEKYRVSKTSYSTVDE